ncbi:50S ribosomal protein L19 [Candidatus Zixiibacteriota bacterium]
MKRLEALAAVEKRTDLPDFKTGDSVKVHVRVVEGEKERIQIFEGIVIGIKGSGNGRTFTVRKISGGVGVERIFPLNSPMISSIELGRRGKVRRAKLNYLRDRVGKRARVKERRVTSSKAAVSDAGEQAASDSSGSGAGENPETS